MPRACGRVGRSLREIHFPTGGAVLQTCFENLLKNNARIAVVFTARWNEQAFKSNFETMKKLHQKMTTILHEIWNAGSRSTFDNLLLFLNRQIAIRKINMIDFHFKSMKNKLMKFLNHWNAEVFGRKWIFVNSKFLFRKRAKKKS